MKPNLEDMVTAIEESAKSPTKNPPIYLLKPSKKLQARKLFDDALKNMFVNYFSGHPPLKDIDKSIYNTELLLSEFDEYLALYKLLCFAWENITEEFKGITISASSPGEALIFILSDRKQDYCKNTENLPNSKAAYLLYCQLKKCDNFVNSEGKINNPKEREKLYKLGKRCGIDFKYSRPSESSIFLQLVLKICKASKNKTIKRAAQDYENIWHENISNSMKYIRRKNFRI